MFGAEATFPGVLYKAVYDYGRHKDEAVCLFFDPAAAAAGLRVKSYSK